MEILDCDCISECISSDFLIVGFSLYSSKLMVVSLYLNMIL